MMGRADMCELLIDQGAVVDAVSPKGSTALQIAIDARFNIKNTLNFPQA
jgi:ankyrin repeat protein